MRLFQQAFDHGQQFFSNRQSALVDSSEEGSNEGSAVQVERAEKDQARTRFKILLP